MMKSAIHSLAEYNSDPGFLLHGSVNASPVNAVCDLHDLTQSKYQSSLLTASYTLCLSLSPPHSLPPFIPPSLSLYLSIPVIHISANLGPWPFLCFLTPDLCCSSIKVNACQSNPTPSLELGSSANSPLSPLDSYGLYAVNIFLCDYYASGTILGTFSLSISSKVLLTLLGGIGYIVFT